MGHVACMGDRRGAYMNLVVKSDGKSPLVLPGYRLEYNIEMDL